MAKGELVEMDSLHGHHALQILVAATITCGVTLNQSCIELQEPRQKI
jgi:hypothetical protein